MGKQKKDSKSSKKLQNIVVIDNYTGNSSILKGNILSSIKKPTSKKSNFIVTYLANKDMIMAPIEINLGISEEDIAGAIENKAYEELGLDPTIEYFIKYTEIPSDGDKKVYQLFIIEQSRYNEIFEELVKNVKYIDLVMPAPLLFRTLYDFDLVEKKGVHCYLYFTKYDTFLSFYKNGEYFYSKSIKYSFEQIYNRYCEMTGETVDEEEFFKILKKEGMRATSSDYQQNIMKLFGEIFISINDIVIYTKRAYDIEAIDNMYIGSSFGSIVGLDDYVQNYLGLHSLPLEFNYKFEIEDWHVDQLQKMMAASGLGYLHGRDTLNLTKYPRPPAFFKRTSGHLVLTTLGVTALGLSVPLYYYAGSKVNNIRNDRLDQKEQSLKREVNKYKSIISKKIAEIKEIDKNIEKKKSDFNAKEMTLRHVYNKKVNYRLKSDQMRLFADDFAKFGVKIYDIDSTDDKFNIYLVSEDDKNITKLIKYISKEYKNQISNIDIDLIEKDSNSTFYQGVLKVGFNE